MVRAASPADAAAIAAIYRPYVEDSATSFEDTPPDADEITLRMLAMPRLPWLVAEDDCDDLIGYAYASAHRSRAAYRWSVDCSVYVDATAHRRGIGRLLYGALLPIVRELGYFRAYAGIALPNPASVGLHEAVGFKLIGVYEKVGYKRGQWLDVGWWQLALRNGDANPDEPRSWQAE